MSYIGQTGMARIDHKNMLNLQQAKHLLISSKKLLSNETGMSHIVTSRL